MDCRVLFLPNQAQISVPTGTLLLDAAKSAGVYIDSPCGGNGTCGKCIVLLDQNGNVTRMLACKTKVLQDCTVTLPQAAQLNTLRIGAERAVEFAPCSDLAELVDGACFAAFDLGTTSIVCYLLDGTTGEQIASCGMQNPQSAYGADVITRGNYVLTSGEPNTLRDSAIRALNLLIERTTFSVGRSPDQVTLVSIVGNTVMHHILLGLPLEQLVRAPYLPFARERRVLRAEELNLRIHANAPVLVAPVIGGFVGADTVACLTATAFDEMKRPTLLLDIGTNGELACTNGVRRVCCSTAAGPAFEGANISCGMRAESGAVDHVWIEGDSLAFSTIDGIPARGICGSGLIDLVAVLLRLGTIDETGRFSEESSLSNHLYKEENGSYSFWIDRGENKVSLSQKDVRELQLGKAAIRAGIETLLVTLSLQTDQVERVLLAGAFGSHISSDALCDIGLLPEAFRNRVTSIGNAAGEGAKIYARNYSLFLQSEPIARETEYIELMQSGMFTEHFVEAMAFPEHLAQEVEHQEANFYLIDKDNVL